MGRMEKNFGGFSVQIVAYPICQLLLGLVGTA